MSQVTQSWREGRTALASLAGELDSYVEQVSEWFALLGFNKAVLCVSHA